MVDFAPLIQVAVIGSDTALACPLLSVHFILAGATRKFIVGVEIVAPGGMESNVIATWFDANVEQPANIITKMQAIKVFINPPAK